MTGSGQTPNKWFVLIMTTLVFIGAVGIPFTAMPVLFSSVTRELRLTLAEVGMIWGALPLGTALSSIPGGMLGDRFGFRKVIGIGCFIIALTNGLRGICVDPVTLTISMFLCGASIGAVIPSMLKVASLFFPPRQLGLVVGIINSGFNIGAILATALGATFLLPLVGSWRNVLFFYSAIGVILGTIWLLVIRETKPSQTTSCTDTTERKVPFRETLGVVLRIKDMWLLAIASVGLVGSFLALMGYAPVYLENIGVPKGTGDTIASTIFVAGILGAIILPALSDRIGARKIILIVCAAVAGISIYLLSISDTMFFWLLMPLIGAFIMGAITLSLAIPLEIKEVGHIYGASAVGLIVASQNLGGFLLPIIGGNLAEINQSLPFVFWAIVIFVAIICLFFIRETGHK